MNELALTHSLSRLVNPIKSDAEDLISAVFSLSLRRVSLISEIDVSWIEEIKRKLIPASEN